MYKYLLILLVGSIAIVSCKKLEKENMAEITGHYERWEDGSPPFLEEKIEIYQNKKTEDKIYINNIRCQFRLLDSVEAKIIEKGKFVIPNNIFASQGIPPGMGCIGCSSSGFLVMFNGSGTLSYSQLLTLEINTYVKYSAEDDFVLSTSEIEVYGKL